LISVTNNRLTARVPEQLRGERLDRGLAILFPDISRTQIKHWILDGHVTVDGRPMRPREKLAGGENIEIDATLEADTAWSAQDLPLNVVYQDEDLIVVDKSAGRVVHPGAGNPDHTLVNALLHYAPELDSVPRAGLIHRLDKDTSGLLVVARNRVAHKRLVEQLQARAVRREYEAIVTGVMIAGGAVDAAIGRHPVHRTRMAVVAGGRPAVTHYRVLERFRNHTYIRLRLETGRTHQIRVHMASIGYPILGDPLYGGGRRIFRHASDVCRQLVENFGRQALHAVMLGLTHPRTGVWMEWRSALPADIAGLLEALREDAALVS